MGIGCAATLSQVARIDVKVITDLQFDNELFPIGIILLKLNKKEVLSFG